MKKSIVSGLFSLVILSGCVSIQGVDVQSDICLDSEHSNCREQWIVHACSVTANSYPYYRDRLLYAGYGELFTENASFQIGDGPKIEGRYAIVQALRNRGPRATSRHFSQVVNMQAVGEDAAKGISYLNIYQVDAQTLAKGDNTVGAPTFIAEYHDTFKIEDNRCLISNRKVVIVFKGAAAK